MVSPITQNLLVILDNTCDYIPLVSTINFFANIHIINHCRANVPNNKIWENRYLNHLFQKDANRISLLFWPIIGNLYCLFIDVYDFKYHFKCFVIPLLKEGKLKLAGLSNKLRDDEEVVLVGMEKNLESLCCMSPRLKSNADFIKQLIAKYPELFSMLGWIGDHQNNIEIVKIAVSKDPYNYTFLKDEFKKDKKLIFEWLEESVVILKYLPHEILSDPEIISFAMSKDPQRTKTFINKQYYPK